MAFVTHVWRNAFPGRPWLAGLWEKDWPAESFTQGEGLPPGPISSLATYHNPNPERPNLVQEFELRLVDLIGGTRKVGVDFSAVEREGGGRGITVRGECGVFYHRWFAHEPIMVKLEAPDGDGNGLWRIYTWWEAVPVLVTQDHTGKWVQV